jgi:hypothetical protein
MGICGRRSPLDTAGPAEQSILRYWKPSQVHTSPPVSCDFQNFYVYDYITELCRTQAEIIQNLVNPNVHGIGQGEAMHRMYKGFYLVACSRSSD